MQKKKVWVLVALAIVGCLLLFYSPKIKNLFSHEATTNKSEPQNFNFNIPINVADDKLFLSVFIEKIFKPVQDPSSFTSGRTLIEFIPQAEDSSNWSEIITLKPHLGIGAKAAQILNSIIEGMKPATKALKILEQQNKAHEGYQDGFRLLTYEHNGSKEILYLYTASGPYDAVTFQYAIRIKKGASIADLSKKLKDFVEKNVKVAKKDVQ